MNGPVSGAVHFGFWHVSQLHHRREVPDKLDLDAGARRRPDHHAVDQGADKLDGFRPGGLIAKQLVKRRDLPTIDGGKVGVEPHRFTGQSGELGCELRLARFQTFEFGLHVLALEGAGGEGIEQSIDFPLDLLGFALERPTARIALAPHAVGLFIESAHELRNKIRRHQLMTNCFDDPGLNLIAPDACPVNAGALATGGLGLVDLATAVFTILRSGNFVAIGQSARQFPLFNATAHAAARPKDDRGR